MQETPSPGVRPELSYRVAGEGRELFSRAQIRDQIRAGSITQQTELAIENSEDYRAASTFPELSRYFALAAPRPAPAGAPVAGAPGPSAATRIFPGLTYPLTGIGGIVILLATIVQPLPFGAIIGAVFTSVYGLAVIRKSSDGSKTMPGIHDLGDPVSFLLSFLKLIVVTLVSAWPVILAIPLTFLLRSFMIAIAAVIVMVLYYPAAVASLAKWNSISIALSPSQIFRMIGTLGSDYVLALITSVFVFGFGALAGFAAGKLIGPSAGVLIGGLLNSWAGFYFFHLLGWGIHHHSDEL